MRKNIFAAMVALLVLLVACASLAMATDAPTPTVHVYGEKPRVDLVADYLQGRGVPVERHYDHKVGGGQFNDDKLPGVIASTTKDSSGHNGIFIPVSDQAVKNVLCPNQQGLLDQFLPKKQVIQQQQSAMPPAQQNLGPVMVTHCDEGPYAGGFWYDVARFARSNGGYTSSTVEIIEVHKHPQGFKAKRGTLDVQNGQGVHSPFANGECRRSYYDHLPSAQELNSNPKLVNSGEKLLNVGSINDPRGGRWDTILVYLVIK